MSSEVRFYIGVSALVISVICLFLIFSWRASRDGTRCRKHLQEKHPDRNPWSCPTIYLWNNGETTCSLCDDKAKERGAA